MLAYIAHALGRDPIKRPRNIARVQRWFRFLIDYGPESWVPSIPWLVYAMNLDEDTYRDRGIRDGQEIIRLYDIIVLVGGEDTVQSTGAQAERETMRQLKRAVCDLTFLGPEPPTKGFVDLIRLDGTTISYKQTREGMSSLVLRHLRR